MPKLPRILYVEDSLRDAELVLAALAENHLAQQVVHLRDGAEALDYLYGRGEFSGRGDEQPTVILLDMKMPRVDGTEVLRQVKSDRALKHIPVVMMTSSRHESDVRESYALGANAYVVKPVRFADFFEAVKTLGKFWGGLNEPPEVPGESAAPSA